MRRRRQSAVYSPGGCGCGLLLLPVIAVSVGVMFALAGLAAAALVLFITAIGVTIWLCRNREQRRADGKTNVGWVVFLIIAYLLSASYLVFFVLLMISAFTGESVTVGLMHCQQTVARSAFARRLDNCIGRLPQP